MSNSLTDIYNDISAHDAAYLEKHAQQIKVAEEEDAAGRIMARGFADELHKLAGDGIVPMPKGETVKVEAPKTKFTPDQQKTQGGMPGRSIKAPSAKKIAPGKGQFGQGDSIAPSGNIAKRPTFKPPGQ